MSTFIKDANGNLYLLSNLLMQALEMRNWRELRTFVARYMADEMQDDVDVPAMIADSFRFGDPIMGFIYDFLWNLVDEGTWERDVLPAICVPDTLRSALDDVLAARVRRSLVDARKTMLATALMAGIFRHGVNINHTALADAATQRINQMLDDAPPPADF